MVITAYNPDTKDLEKTFLAQYTAEGSSSLSVKNTNTFSSSKRILIGRMGAERAELITTGTVTAPNTIAVSTNTKFAHNADDPVYLLQWDQVRFYRASSAGGSYSLLATVDIDVDNADKVTRYDDTTGLSTHFYKIAYYNSVSTTEGDLSDAIAATGYSQVAIGKVIDAVVRRVRDSQYTVLGPDEYLDIAQEVNDDLITQTHRPYRFLKRDVVLDTTLDVGYIDLDSDVPDFWKFNYLEYTDTTAGISRTYKIDEPLSAEAFNRKYLTTNWSNSDSLIDIAIDEDNNRILLGPTPRTSQVGVITLHYYKKFSEINSVGDLVETPNTLVYRYKMMAEFYSAKAETDNKWARLAEKYEGKYGNEVVKMQRVNRLDAGSPRSFAPRRVPGLRKRYHL